MKDETKDSTVKVKLEWYEFKAGAEAGVLRQASSRRDNRQPRRKFTEFGEGLLRDITGALGEVVAAKALGKFWSPTIDTFRKKPDVGNFEVKTNDKDFTIVHPKTPGKEDDHHIVVKVRALDVYLMEWRIVGWITFGEGRSIVEATTRKYGRPEHFVPDYKLHPIEDFEKPEPPCAPEPPVEDERLHAYATAIEFIRQRLMMIQDAHGEVDQDRHIIELRNVAADPMAYYEALRAEEVGSG